MDPVIEYYFGSGDGSLTHWRSPADTDVDGDGTADAVALDFDGDGRVDDLLWDTDGDGTADLVGLDLDDDGAPEVFYRDSGRGLWEVASARPGDAPEKAPADVHRPIESTIDTDGDGSDDIVLLDTDGDGYADTYREADTATGTSAKGGPSTR